MIAPLQKSLPEFPSGEFLSAFLARLEALKAADPKFDSKDESGAERSDDYVRARFDAAVEYAQAAGRSLSKLRRDATDATHQTAEDPLLKAQVQFHKDAAEAWKAPGIAATKEA